MEAAAAALQAHGQRLLDDAHFTVSPRTWRRWEGRQEQRGWPPEETAQVLHDALGRWPEDLGFSAPAGWIRPERQYEDQVERRTFITVTQAQVRTDLGDGHGVIELCEAALDDSDHLVPKARIMAMQQQAHGASLTGDRTTVDRLIDTANGLIHRVDDDLPWGNACRRTPGHLEVQRATCYGRLGLAREAGLLWSQILDAVPSTARRDRGVYLARQATAAAAGREPDQALEIARSAAAIAVETRSVRLARELATLERAMRPWQDAVVGRDLAEILAPVTEGA